MEPIQPTDVAALAAQDADLFRSVATVLRFANTEAQSGINRLSGHTSAADWSKLEGVLSILQGAGGSSGVDPKDPGILEGVARFCDAAAAICDQAAQDGHKP